MREKLRTLDGTFLDLSVGIFLFGVLVTILGMIMTKGNLWYLVGSIVGVIAAEAMLIHMTVSIKKSVEMDPNRAKKYMIRCVLIRYVAMFAVMYIGIQSDYVCFLGIVIGCLGSKMSAHFHDVIHQHITVKILG